MFVLDMGEQIRVADLAKNMILLSGHVPDKDIKITYTGLRPGEKLYEELFGDKECVEPTSHAKIKRAITHVAFGPGELDRHIEELDHLLQDGHSDRIVRKLGEMVSSYEPDLSDASR